MDYQKASDGHKTKLQNEMEELKEEQSRLRRTIESNDALKKIYNEQCEQQSGNPSTQYIEMAEKLDQKEKENEFLKSELERVNKVHFNLDDNVRVLFYQDLCSDIKLIRQQHVSTEQLTIIADTYYDVDKVYLIKGSQVYYTFSKFILETQDSLSCIAKVHVFQEYTKYLKFLVDGDTTQSYSQCISSSERLNFPSLSADQNGYHFIAVEGLTSTTLNYTVVSDILEYDTTNWSPTRCRYSASSRRTCSIRFDDSIGGQKICVVASLLESDFVTLRYYSFMKSSTKYLTQRFFIITWLFFTWLFCAVTILIMICCVIACFCCFVFEKSHKIL